ncbi:MAG: glycosyltransferase, partial [Candidatus Acidiferrales bacterium]
VNVGGIPDVVESGREGLLIEPTTAAISVALRRLLSDPRLREELGARGRQRANGEFTFQNFQRRLLAILNEIA